MKRLSTALAAIFAAAPMEASAQDCTPYANVCEAACSASQYQTACEGTVNFVNDIFRDKNGNTAQSLTLATYVRGGNSYACGYGVSDPSTGSYTCYAVTSLSDPAIAQAANSLDYRWVQNYRVYPDGGEVCDCQPNFYDPTGGLIFDLGGEANKVVLFPIIDHGPLPCEAFEYSVYLSDNPNATEVIPLGQTVDPTKWNEAQLYKAFSQGWDPDSGADGFTTVWQLPCGVTFRYASLVAGNHGNPTPACEYDSNEDELDAVAGLNEDETAICPDRDHDGYADIACGGTDCNDNDPTIHPNAPENCSSPYPTDCDGPVPTCPSGTTCAAGQCAASCVAELGCPNGLVCQQGACLPAGCTSACDAGFVCNGTACVDPCVGAQCPAGQTCVGGGCVDPCLGVTCAPNQICAHGSCVAGCACAGCPSGSTCADGGACVQTSCAQVSCPAGAACVNGVCVDACSAVRCPLGQLCTAGQCVADPCFGISCPSAQVCQAGTCVFPTGSDGGAVIRDAGRPGDGGRDGGNGDGGGSPGGTDGGSSGVGASSGCHCGFGGLDAAASLLLALGLLGAARRRRA